MSHEVYSVAARDIRHFNYFQRSLSCNQIPPKCREKSLTIALKVVDGECNKDILSERLPAPRSVNANVCPPTQLPPEGGRVTLMAAFNTRMEHFTPSSRWMWPRRLLAMAAQFALSLTGERGFISGSWPFPKQSADTTTEFSFQLQRQPQLKWPDRLYYGWNMWKRLLSVNETFEWIKLEIESITRILS